MEGHTGNFLGKGPPVFEKRRNTRAYVRGYNPFSNAQCGTVLDTTTHVGTGEGNTCVHEMRVCLTDNCTLMRECSSDRCACVHNFEKNRCPHVHTCLGESRTFGTRLRG
jgi:hypothetical protein